MDDVLGSPLNQSFERMYDYSNCIESTLYVLSQGYGGIESKVKLLCGACFWGKLEVVKELVENHKLNPDGM